MLAKFCKKLLLLSSISLLSLAFAATTHAATISGTVYSDAGVTTMPDGATVRILQNGFEVEGGTTDVLASGDGTYSLNTGPTLIAPGDIVTVYLDSGDGVSGVTVTVQDNGDEDITNLDIYQDHLIATHEVGRTEITVTNLETGIPNALTTADTDVSNLVTNTGTLLLQTDKSLLVDAGATLEINENIFAYHLKVDGTLEINGTSIGISGDITVGAAGDITSTVANNINIFNTSATQNLTINNAGGLTGTGVTFLVNQTGQTFNFLSTADLGAANFRVDAGTVETNDNDLSANAITMNGGTFNQGASIITLETVTDCIVLNDGTFNTNTGDIDCSGGGGDMNLQGGDLNHGSGTIDLGTSPLEITDAGSTYTGTTGTLEANNFVVSAGTFILPDTVIMNNGNIQLDAGATFEANDSTITKQFGADPAFTGTATSITLHNYNLNRELSIGDFNVFITGDLELTDDLAFISTAGAGDLTFEGSDPQNLTTTAGSQSNIDVDVIVDKADGSLILANSISLDEAGQTLTINQGILDLNGSDLTVDTSITVNAGVATTGITLEGDETVSPDPTLDAESRITYDGTAGPYTVKDWAYGHLYFTGNATFNLPDDLTTLGDLYLTSATSTVVSPATDVNIGGSFVNAGNFTATDQTMTIEGTLLANTSTFTPNGGTVVLGGTDNGIFGDFTFYNLTKLDDTDDSTNKTLTFNEGDTTTVTNTLTLQGTDSDDLVVLVSSNPGTEWNLDVQGTTSLEYVSTTDSDASAGNEVECFTGCVDGGNNTNWSFTATAPRSSSGSGGAGLQPNNPDAATTNTTTDPTNTDTPALGSFTDLNGHWAFEYIKHLVELDIMQGRSDTEFAPDMPMTRAEFIKIALLAYGYEIAADAEQQALLLDFVDLYENEWHLKYMFTAYQSGLIFGFDNNTLRPNQQITRAEALTIISRIENWDLDTLDTSITFPDVSSTDWFYAVVLKAAELGIVSGYEDGSFGATDNVLRAQAAKIISNLIDQM